MTRRLVREAPEKGKPFRQKAVSFADQLSRLTLAACTQKSRMEDICPFIRLSQVRSRSAA
jgi:hypothetical protein